MMFLRHKQRAQRFSCWSAVLVLCIIFFVLACPSRGYAYDSLKFHHGPDIEGATTVVQDSTGFLWFGTGSGLLRYDGYDIVSYTVQLSHQEVLGILEDQTNPHILWIATFRGLNRMDQRTETFTHYLHSPDDATSISDNYCKALLQDSVEPRYLWIGTRKGDLNRLDTMSDTFTVYPSDTGGYIADMIEDRNDSNILWLATYQGLKKFDKRTETFTSYPTNTSGEGVLLFDVLQDSSRSQVLWLGTEAGLLQFDGARETFSQPLGSDRLPEGYLLSIHEASSGSLWLAIRDIGLVVYDTDTGLFVVHRPDVQDPYSLHGTFLHEMYQDRTGTIWLLHENGIDRYDPQKQRFNLYHPRLMDDMTVPPSVYPLYEDHAGRIWCDVAGAGLLRVDPSTNESTWIDLHAPDEPVLVRRIFEDTRGLVWVSGVATRTSEVVFGRLDTKTGTYTPYTAGGLPFVNDIAETSDTHGRLWLATEDGLGLYDTATHRFQLYADVAFDIDEASVSGTSHPIVSMFADEQANVLWLSLWDTLVRFEVLTGAVTTYRYNPVDPQTVGEKAYVVYQDDDGMLWLSSDEGLEHFDPVTGVVVRRYGPDNGFVHHVVSRVVKDATGDFWAGTNDGIIRFDLQTGTVVRHYTKSDGLPSNSIFPILHARDGSIWFGGKALGHFLPDAVQDNPHVPPIVLTSLTSGGYPIDKDTAVPYIQSVTVDWQRNFFAFTYAALNYTNPNKQEYAYILEGWDDDWYYAGHVHSGRYAGLKPGIYTLRIKGTNNDTLWNEQGVAITITVTPPWWGTWWFRGGAMIVLVSVLLGGYLWRVHMMRQHTLLLETQVAERTRELSERTVELACLNVQLEQAMTQAEDARRRAEIANQAKSTFLATMSHELRTPMNAILGFAQIMYRDATLHPDHREHVQIIHRSGEHLLSLINDVLDMSKIEAGYITLNETSFDVLRMLNDIEHMFDVRAREKGIKLSFVYADDLPRIIQADERKLRQVLINILSNAMKFTSEGCVTLRVSRSAETLERRNAGALERRSVGMSEYRGDVAETERYDDEAAMEQYGEVVTEHQNDVMMCVLGFAVTDSGPGIAPDEIETIFEPFKQTSVGQQSQEGTGLGLPISRKFVQMMGGTLTVESEVGRGSTFAWTVQVGVTAAAACRVAAPISRHVVALAPGQPIYRLLIVDDKPGNRQLLSKLLSMPGFDLRDASNGVEAVACCREWQPHFIWMDVRMPVLDGYQATRQIRAIESIAQPVIIALTASVLDDEQALVLEAGCNDFLRKPFREDALFALMQTHLGVEFVYADEESEDASELAVNSIEQNGEDVEQPQICLDEADMVARLQRLSDEVRAALQHATDELNPAATHSIIERIRDTDAALADALDALVYEYRFDLVDVLLVDSRTAEQGSLRRPCLDKEL